MRSLRPGTKPGRALLTHNVPDFLTLAQQAEGHAGVLAIFRDGNPRSTMGYEQIVRAIAALEAAACRCRGSSTSSTTGVDFQN